MQIWNVRFVFRVRLVRNFGRVSIGKTAPQRQRCLLRLDVEVLRTIHSFATARPHHILSILTGCRYRNEDSDGFQVHPRCSSVVFLAFTDSKKLKGRL